MKRILVVALCAIVLFSLVACEQPEDASRMGAPATKTAATGAESGVQAGDAFVEPVSEDRSASAPPQQSQSTSLNAGTDGPTPLPAQNSAPVSVAALESARHGSEMRVNAVACADIFGERASDLLSRYGGGEAGFRVNPFTGQLENTLVLRDLGATIAYYEDNLVTAITTTPEAFTLADATLDADSMVLDELLGVKGAIADHLSDDTRTVRTWDRGVFRIYASFLDPTGTPTSITIVDTAMPSSEDSGFGD